MKTYRGGDWIMSPIPYYSDQTTKYLTAMNLRSRLIDSSVANTFINHEEVDYSTAELLSGEESLAEKHPKSKFIYVWISTDNLVERVIKRYNKNKWLESQD